jgi:hypothetical protein
VRNRQRADRDLVDDGDIALVHKPVQRWNLPDGWVISRKPAHPALVSEADFIAAQDSGDRGQLTLNGDRSSCPGSPPLPASPSWP